VTHSTPPRLVKETEIEFPFTLEIDGDRLTGFNEHDEHPRPETDFWIAPAFWDLQCNGRWGWSFSDPTLSVEQVAAIVRAQVELGTAHVCPTLITAPLDDLRAGLATIDRACESDPVVARMVPGIHLEGPWISGIDGYRGAHPLHAVRDPDWDDFLRLQDAAGGRIVLVTLAPERPGSIAFIERLKAAGVVVALGHTAADPATIDAAASAGATLATHLGNGIAAMLPRHPNPIWCQAADERLMVSFIADGHHLDRATLKVLIRAVGPGRRILVSDASPLAGLPPGRYGDWEVDPSGKINVAGTLYLAGSNRDLPFALGEVRASYPHCLPNELLAMVVEAPTRLLGKPEPQVGLGGPDDYVIFCLPERSFELVGTFFDGRWVPRGDASRPGA
jgi:N-acetylglucosamine-6-phosphate deacetylase